MGGSEKACVRVANALAERYYITICTVFGSAGLEQEVSDKVNLIHKFPKFIRGFAKIIYLLNPRRAYKYLVKGRYDIEIAVGDGLESFVVSGSPNPNKYSWIHMNLGNNGTKRNEESLRKYSVFKKIICVSESNRYAFIKEMGFEQKTTTVYTPCNLEGIIKKSNEFDVTFAKKTILAVGRLETVKGYDRLIKAVSMIPHKDFDLVIVGDGTQRTILQNQIVQAELSDRVHLIGQIINPYPYIKFADVLVCSSIEESFGFTLVEAMGLRTPVISTKCGGVEEIIQDETQGILCDNSVEGIKCGIERFLNCQHKIDVESAYQRAKDFDIDNCVNNFIKIIEG